MPKHCAHCGTPFTDQARFCHRCGSPRDGGSYVAGPGVGPNAGPGAGPGAGPAAASQVLPWAVAGIALLCLLGFVVGSFWSGSRRATPVANAGSMVSQGPAVDISQMTPQERADRLFNRVMLYVSEGKMDSVEFFAPMAINSFIDLEPLDAHHRYDLGLLGLVSGDIELASAQADTILADQPDHLLGLLLAMRSAGIQLDSVARNDFANRLIAALPTEQNKRLPEYTDHEPDIDAALREASGRTPPSTSLISPTP